MYLLNFKITLEKTEDVTYRVSLLYPSYVSGKSPCAKFSTNLALLELRNASYISIPQTIKRISQNPNLSIN